MAKKHRYARSRPGRPAGRPEKVRRNRTVVMLTDADFEKLGRLAEKLDLPMGTVAYQFVAHGLARRRTA